MKKLSIIIKLAISLVFISILIFKVGYEEVISALSNSDGGLVILIFFVTVFTFLLYTVNYYILLRALQIKISLLKVFRASTLSWSLGAMSPGRIGEISLLYSFKKEIPHSGKIVAIYLVNKVITFALFSIICVFGILYFFSLKIATITFGVYLIMGLLFLFFFLTKFGRSFIRRIIIRK